jgi:hypothetical protein
MRAKAWADELPSRDLNPPDPIGQPDDGLCEEVHAGSVGRRRGPAVLRRQAQPRLRTGVGQRVRASSSETPHATLSSEARITRAFSSMDFSPADSPLAASRRARFRTTSATWYTSPDLSFSWWFLKRRLQFDGSRTSFLPSSCRRSSTSSLLIGGRIPTSSALSVGHRERQVPVHHVEHEVLQLLAADLARLLLLDDGAPWWG